MSLFFHVPPKDILYFNNDLGQSPYSDELEIEDYEQAVEEKLDSVADNFFSPSTFSPTDLEHDSALFIDANMESVDFFNPSPEIPELVFSNSPLEEQNTNVELSDLMKPSSEEENETEELLLTDEIIQKPNASSEPESLEGSPSESSNKKRKLHEKEEAQIKTPPPSKRQKRDDFSNGYSHLKNYVRREGNAQITTRHIENGFYLGRWVGKKREAFKKGTLDKKQIKKLESLPGWEWDINANKFQKGLSFLRTYFEREGHCLVPKSHKEDSFRLGEWILRLRRAQREKKLDKEEVQVLEAFPTWSWNARQEKYNYGLYHLKRFVKKEGHACVPTQYIQANFKLGTWVSTQRKAYSSNKMPEKRIHVLEKFPGWTWNNSGNNS